MDNFRTAIAWSDSHGDAERTVRLAAFIPWSRFGYLAEGARRRDEALHLLNDVSPAARARLLVSASFSSWQLGEPGEGRVHAERGIALSRKLGDRNLEADGLVSLSIIAGIEGDPAARRSYADAAEVIYRDLGNQMMVLDLLHNDGLWAMDAGDYVEARSCLERALAGARELGYADGIANALSDLGVVCLYERRLEDALRLFEESLELSLESAWHISVAWTVSGVGSALSSLGEFEAAARVLGAAEALHERSGREIEAYARKAFDECSTPLRERLSEPELAAAWAAGRALNEAEAAAYALATIGERAPL
jgi:tetratricopeptide (TPR) repeat protein